MKQKIVVVIVNIFSMTKQEGKKRYFEFYFLKRYVNI